MATSSWLHLAAEDPRYALPESLRLHDPMGARDCGWVDQMLPFIHSHASAPGWIIDPFCGFGSTLVAASLAGVPAAGIEISAQRSALARQRLALLGKDSQTYPVLTGTISQASTREDLVRPNPHEDARRFTLCLTNVPYFGSSAQPEMAQSMAEDQLYAEQYYAPYLQGIRDVFASIYDLLEPEAWCVVMAQNLRLGSAFVPLAWDIARLLSDRFVLHEERLLIYERASDPNDVPAAPTNRAHEYALVCRKQPAGLDTAEGQRLLSRLVEAGFEFAVYGSFARWLCADSHAAPRDIDLLCPPGEAEVARLLQWLDGEGFLITAWNTPLRPPVPVSAFAHRHYFRTKRLRRDGTAMQIDVAMVADRATFDARVASRHRGAPALPYALLTNAFESN